MRMMVVYISLENGVIPIKFSCLLVPKAVDDTAFDFSSSAGYAVFLMVKLGSGSARATLAS